MTRIDYQEWLHQACVVAEEAGAILLGGLGAEHDVKMKGEVDLVTEMDRASESHILRRLRERHIEVLLCGMLAATNLGADYGRAFNQIFPDLAASGQLLLYPFFLAGVLDDQQLVQRDRLHPTAAGVDAIVAGILPQAEELVARVRSRRGG